MNDAGDDRASQLEAERGRAAAEGRPHAVLLECDLVWDIGAPAPTIVQWEHEALLFFHLSEQEAVGLVAFDGCRSTCFGPPGEEGHRLEGSGWDAYTPLRVVNSPWVERMFGTAAGLTHFLFPFHDTTFECIAQSFETSRLPGSMAAAVQAAVARWE